MLDVVVQRRVQALGRVPFEDDEQRRRRNELQRAVDGELDADACRPDYWGNVWRGEGDAREAAARELIHVADDHGRLRALLDATRANRVQDDFSPK